MQKVVIIGGGLSGLSAAHELTKLGIQPTLIEVKPTLGGSIKTVQKAGFVFDNGPMLHPVYDTHFLTRWLATLRLSGSAIFTQSDEVIFTHGAGMLIDALAAAADFTLMQRMAVSTIGQMSDRHFTICMENGMLLEAQALIIAAPARHAERIFHTMVPEIGFRLRDYRYDPVVYVSIGYRDEDNFIFDTTPPTDYPISRIDATTMPGRVPERGTLLQACLRYVTAAERPSQGGPGLPADPVGEIAALMGWPANPAVDHLGIWSESDPVMWRDSAHPVNMKAIIGLLPAGVALCGNDYIEGARPPGIDERIKQGIAAARSIAAFVASSD